MKKMRFSLLAATLLVNSWSMYFSPPAAAVSFSTPKGSQGAPRQPTTGGATRSGSSCLVSQGGVTPLLPNTNLGLTVAERPTFFVYVPQTTAKEASFSLQDESQNLIYRTKVALPSTGGVVSISLPKTATALEVGKDYKWVVEIHCLADLDPDNPLVNGWVRRTQVNPALADKLKQAKTSVERAEVYSEAGIWYEAIASMADARRSQPQDSRLAQSWEQLLTSVGLEAIATQPLTY
jgi:Domain of Unknown Function (DUF928)